jgi:hypothetical protein
MVTPIVIETRRHGHGVSRGHATGGTLKGCRGVRPAGDVASPERLDRAGPPGGKPRVAATSRLTRP